MKFSNPNNIAGILALFIMLFIAIIGFCVHMLWTYDFNVYALFIVCLLVVYLFSYIIIKVSVQKFIYDKIKLIYKTIHNFKVYKGQENGNNKRKELKNESLENVKKTVTEWVRGQKKEIEDLKKQEEYRREFIGDLSHELKTPIFNIQGYVLTLLDGALDDTVINREYLLRTEKSINRMISIVKDLDAIARLESGELTMKMERFDIILLIQEVYEFLEIQAKKRDIKLGFKKNHDKSLFVVGDKENIRQVATNLVDNSIKYGKTGGHTNVSFFDLDENILIEFTDNGIGIEREKIPRLFDRFYRIDKSRSREQGGSGLGLAIVKHILEAHNQTINVRSTTGVGTTFAFTLKKG